MGGFNIDKYQDASQKLASIILLSYNSKNDLKECIPSLTNQTYQNYEIIVVRVYNDIVEFYNPGYSLKDPAQFDSPGSKLRNPLIAAVFYDIGWAEAKGTGINTTRERLQAEGYPMPEYANDMKRDTFTLILGHPDEYLTTQVTSEVDIYTEEYLYRLGLNDRQVKAVVYVKEKGMITNKEYQDITGISRQMATIDLNELTDKNVFQRIGTIGRGVAYKMTKIADK